MKRTRFFAAGEDLLDVWATTSLCRARVSRATVSARRATRTFGGLADVPKLSKLQKGYLETLIVHHTKTPKFGRTLGGKFVVDLQFNPDGLLLLPGGSTRGFVLSGSVSSTGTPRSEAWRIELERAMSVAFTDIRGTLVGRTALERLRAGDRLVDSLGSPSEYDLREAPVRRGRSRASRIKALREVFVGARFVGLDLTGSATERCQFDGCLFEFAKLDDSRFTQSSFVDCGFSGASMSNTVFRSCEFDRCSFDRADLSNVDFRRSDFALCSFKGAKLQDALVEAAELPELDLSAEQRASLRRSPSERRSRGHARQRQD